MLKLLIQGLCLAWVHYVYSSTDFWDSSLDCNEEFRLNANMNRRDAQNK